ncbi:hypothetical protein [Bifidobacterium platyrrhinorum]|uniref:Uncharacterized protein n=1 Tax=Bifidobacterium platyrrhinorum TaxID=2661628 RepID=A0A6L9SUY5_9BIFI|nr:hypothetical protein [Bifidobacterium platyrrhinorum]NEG55653.1 hypothetical protein [Bifidobacterium platyrrhinorum]
MADSDATVASGGVPLPDGTPAASDHAAQPGTVPVPLPDGARSAPETQPAAEPAAGAEPDSGAGEEAAGDSPETAPDADTAATTPIAPVPLPDADASAAVPETPAVPVPDGVAAATAATAATPVPAPAAGPAAPAPAAAAARKPRPKWMIPAIVAAVVAVVAAIVGVCVYFFVIKPSQSIGFQSTVHAAATDMPRVCRDLLGSDGDVSQAFGVNVTAAEPGSDEADNGVCVYREDGGTAHNVYIGYTQGATKARVQGTSANKRYRIYLADNDSIVKNGEAAQRAADLFGKSASRLTDDSQEWSSKLPTIDSGSVVIPKQTVCKNGPCTAFPQENGGSSDKNGSSDGNNGSNGSGSDKNGSGNESGNGSGDSDIPAVGDSTPVAYAYDSSLALLDKPIAVKAKLDDGSVSYVKPADGQTFLTLDFRRAPANDCDESVCSWSAKPSDKATLTVAGKASKDADNVLAGVVKSDRRAHGTFVASTSDSDPRIELSVTGDGKTYTTKLDVNATKTKTADDQLRETAKTKAVESLKGNGKMCPSSCTATGAVLFDHPVWGRTAVVTLGVGGENGTAPGMSNVKTYSEGYAYAIVPRSGQAMYGRSEIPGTYEPALSIVPVMDAVDKAGHIALATFSHANDGELDEPLVLEPQADGTLKNVSPDPDKANDGNGVCLATMSSAGDLDKNGVAAYTYSGSNCYTSLGYDRKWTWSDGGWKDSAAPLSEATAKNNALYIAYVLYGDYGVGPSSDDLIPVLSPNANIYSYDTCSVKPASQVGATSLHGASDVLRTSLETHFFFMSSSKGGDDLFAPAKYDSTACQQYQTPSGISGLGGAGPKGSVSLGDVSYDASSRTATIASTTRWTAMTGSNSSDPGNTSGTITITLDDNGLLLKAGATNWGFPSTGF